MFTTKPVQGVLDNRPFSYKAGDVIERAHHELLKAAGVASDDKPKEAKK